MRGVRNLKKTVAPTDSGHVRIHPCAVDPHASYCSMASMRGVILGLSRTPGIIDIEVPFHFALHLGA